MSQSESEGESPPLGDDGPIFPFEKLYFSKRDKAEIDALPEIRRESILAERTAQLERHDQDVTLRRLLAARAKQDAKESENKKRKAGAADLEERQRKSSRQRTKLGGGKVGEKDSAIEAYKRQRAEKELRSEQRRRDAAARKELGSRDSPENNYSEADADGESEVEWDNKYRRRSPTPPRDEPIAELADIQRAKVGRDNFAEVCFYPGFEDAITDCYARVCLGPGGSSGQNVYRLCKIKGFKTGRPYAMEGRNGRKFPVDQYIVATHGKAEKEWSFLECSMSGFTEDEWRRYRITMANEDCKLPTQKAVNKKLDQIKALLNHRFTEAQITEKIRKQSAVHNKIYRVEEKGQIEERKQKAFEAEDYEAVAACDDELAALVPIKLAFGTSLAQPAATHINKEQERLAELNRRNQKLNAENVRKAQIAEMKAKKTKKHLTPGIDDLFDGNSDISRTGTPRGGTPRGSTPVPNGIGASKPNGNTPRSGTPSNLIRPVQKDKKGIPTIRKAKLDDEILASMDLGINLDI